MNGTYLTLGAVSWIALTQKRQGSPARPIPQKLKQIARKSPKELFYSFTLATAMGLMPHWTEIQEPDNFPGWLESRVYTFESREDRNKFLHFLVGLGVIDSAQGWREDLREGKGSQFWGNYFCLQSHENQPRYPPKDDASGQVCDEFHFIEMVKADQWNNVRIVYNPKATLKAWQQRFPEENSEDDSQADSQDDFWDDVFENSEDDV